jgi:hypothetical protein
VVVWVIWVPPFLFYFVDFYVQSWCGLSWIPWFWFYFVIFVFSRGVGYFLNTVIAFQNLFFQVVSFFHFNGSYILLRCLRSEPTIGAPYLLAFCWAVVSLWRPGTSRHLCGARGRRGASRSLASGALFIVWPMSRYEIHTPYKVSPPSCFCCSN